MLGFPRQARITRGAELQRIAREGKRIRTVHLEVRAASPLARSGPEAAEAAYPGMRIGFVIPKYKHSGVARNRLKRRLRELSRLRLLPARLAADVVIRVRPEAYGASFESLGSEIAGVLLQLVRWRDALDARPAPQGETA